MSIAIGSFGLNVPLIQGGMGIGVSLGGLAGAVAANGGMGVISGANPGFAEEDFAQNPYEANLRALRREIAKAKEIASGRGMVAVNLMVATRQYAELAAEALKSGANAIISGAGLPLALPGLAAGSKAALAPIVSSPRAAETICKLWQKRFDTAPDFVVVEGPLAGGHLGYSREELLNGTAPKVEDTLAAVVKALRPVAEKLGRAIPVFAAGGLATRQDVRRVMDRGAAGVQVATRFIATHECDAAPAYKQMMLDARPEDVVIVQSPVGMPGRALCTPLIRRLEEHAQPGIGHCFACLTPCNPAKAPYCITAALAAAVQGDVENGLFFCGGRVAELEKLVRVKELMDELMNDGGNER